jgi:hypothetical protein
VETQENPREVVDPVRRGAASAEGVLHAAVEAFHHSVGLRVLGSSLDVLDVEQAAQGGPQGGGELGPAVRCYDCRYSESAHPSLKQCICAVYCCSGGDGYRLRPTGGSVNDGEQIGKPFGWRQGAYQVHVDVAEMAGGYRDVLRGYLYMAVDFGPLAAQAGLHPGGDICRETFPNIPGGDEAAGRLLARMGGTVEMFEYLSQEVPGHQQAECAGG